MSSEAIATVIKMMESLPEPAQNQVAEHLRDYLTEVQDELRWDDLFNKTQSGHDHRFGHSNLQESQLTKVDSNAKEGTGRNDDHGPQSKLVAMARLAKEQIAECKARPLDYNEL